MKVLGLRFVLGERVRCHVTGDMIEPFEEKQDHARLGWKCRVSSVVGINLFQGFWRTKISPDGWHTAGERAAKKKWNDRVTRDSCTMEFDLNKSSRRSARTLSLSLSLSPFAAAASRSRKVISACLLILTWFLTLFAG